MHCQYRKKHLSLTNVEIDKVHVRSLPFATRSCSTRTCRCAIVCSQPTPPTKTDLALTQHCCNTIVLLVQCPRPHGSRGTKAGMHAIGLYLVVAGSVERHNRGLGKPITVVLSELDILEQLLPFEYVVHAMGLLQTDMRPFAPSITS
jgi:hypothetical protein